MNKPPAAQLTVHESPALPAEPPGSGQKPYTAPTRQVWGWGVGRLAEFCLICTFGHTMAVFTVGFGLNPVIVSWCMMLPRLIDGLIDPVIGHWSDETHTRWGRRKPFLMGGAALGVVFLNAMWWTSPNWSSTTQFLYLGITSMCLYVCYGTFTMAWNAVGYELSDDYHERSRIAAIGGFFLAGIALLNSWLYWIALRPTFGGVIFGMRWVAAGLSIIILLSALYTTLSVRERFKQANRTHIALMPAIRATLKNRAFVVLMLMKIFEIFGGRLVGGVSFFLMVYYTCQGDQDLATRIGGIAATLGTVWSFAVLPMVKPVSKWVGKRGALIAGAALSFVGAIVSPFVTTPDHPWLGLIPGLIIGPLLIISSTIAGAILPDICDVDELQTGQRREGLFTAVMGFVSKLEISLAILLSGYIVTWSAIDTSIGLRWDKLVDGKADVVSDFKAGELGVFRLKDTRPALFDSIKVDGQCSGVELAVSDESPTEGFRTVGAFDMKSGTMTGQWSIDPTRATYVRVRILSTDHAHSLAMQEISLSNGSAGQNLLTAANGGKSVAVQPPTDVQHRVYWLVMIPGIVFTGLTFATTILFPLNERKMLDVRRRLDALRGQGALP
ncbi:MAG: MFS transporter [Tepidisphaeraceae bacterium]